MVWYFYQSQNKIQKKKGKIKQKIKGKKLTCRPGGAGPASPPGPPGAGGSSSTSRAPKLLGGMPPSQPGATRRRRRASRPPRALFSRLETPLFRPHRFPPSTSFLLFCSARFVAARGTRRSAVEQPRGQ